MATLDETEDIFEPDKKPGRSPVERIIVWGLIVALLAVVGLEFRAQKGYSNSREALENYATEHPDDEMKFSFAKESMQYGPSIDGPKPSPTNKMADLYVFSWMSIFKSGEYRIFVEVENGKEPFVFTFYTPRADEDKAEPSNAVLPPDNESASTDGGFGRGNGQRRNFRNGDFGNGQFGNRQDNGPGPMTAALDKDGNGELSESEIDNATVILQRLDTNEDGEITSDEIENLGGGDRPQRPQLE